MDSLQNWVCMGIQRRGAQDLTTATFIVESIVELQMSGKEKSNPSKGKDGGNGDHEKLDRPKHYKATKKGTRNSNSPKRVEISFPFNASFAIGCIGRGSAQGGVKFSPRSKRKIWVAKRWRKGPYSWLLS